MNLFTSKWSPISRVPSIEADGILKAWTTKLVPKSARITVTKRDSRYSEKVVWSSWRSCFFSDGGAGACTSVWVSVSSGIPLSLSLPRVREVPGQTARRAALLLFSCCLLRWPCIPRQSKLQSGKPFGGRVRFLQRDDIPPEFVRGLAEVPAKLICGRTRKSARRAPQEPVQTELCATPPVPHQVRRRCKPRQPPLRTRRHARSA